ncbi:hypothetical protein [Mycoplasma sp. E35C]|uniref:hypothetical protein n=1 Tax=Mycoplasma sp. E35C TaxID=2801918 RepID=UPI001CA39EF0|nr:hypothetical protein [Mycoplasma sp. E35C]QZX49409.1 hypothetical protein JJE79_01525 [Mycoplasma sp. E35C]
MNKSKRFNILKKSFLASAILAPIALSSCSGGGVSGEAQEKTTTNKTDNTSVTVKLAGNSFKLANKFDQHSVNILKITDSIPSISGGNFNLTNPAAVASLSKGELPSTNSYDLELGMLLQKTDFENLIKAIKVNDKGLKAVSILPAAYQNLEGASKVYSAKAVDEDSQQTNGIIGINSYLFSASNVKYQEDSKSLDLTLNISKGSSWTVSFENIKFTDII